MTQRLPLVVVLGATACGKSRLAIELARRFGGEIISADSMQVYLGLDIVTNKVTHEERRQAKHHLIDFLEPQKRYSVTDFRNKSLEIIDNLQTKNKLPIVVGGTNYYIESILWKNFLLGPTLRSAKRHFDEASTSSDLNTSLTENSPGEDTLIDSEEKELEANNDSIQYTEEHLEDVDKFFSTKIYQKGLKQSNSEKLWRLLEKVDPKSAHSTHMHDKRKIIRYLQVIQERQRNYSDILEEVNRSDNDSVSLGGSLRYSPVCVLWLDYPNLNILDEVLDERVDQMMNRGLVAELEQFHKEYNQQRIQANESSNYQEGIFQTIGFKEFHRYLILDESAKKSEDGKALLLQSILDMKISTRRYARRQLKWIRRRFLQSGFRDLPLVFKFQSTSDDDSWQKDVLEPAYSIVETLRDGRHLDSSLLKHKQEPEEQSAVNKPAKHYCEYCDRVFIGSNHIEAHLKSRRHEKIKSKKLRMEYDARSNESLPDKKLNKHEAI